MRVDLAEHAHHRRRRCDDGMTGTVTGVAKRSYTSEGAAKRAAEQLTENHGREFHWYRCRCGRWHTSTSAPRR